MYKIFILSYKMFIKTVLDHIIYNNIFSEINFLNLLSFFISQVMKSFTSYKYI